MTTPLSDPGLASPPSPYDDDPTPCPECGTPDQEYDIHKQGCPSGYPAYDPALDATYQEIDEMQKVAWEMEEAAHGD